MQILIKETILFGIIMVIFGFLNSYITDFILNRPIDWLPKHSSGMASGIFTSSALVFYLFSNDYIKYKCSN